MSAPRLRAGLEVVALPDGVVVVNGGPPVRFRGRAATEVLAPLLRVLDGELDPSGLADRLNAKPGHVERALGILADHDLLEP